MAVPVSKSSPVLVKPSEQTAPTGDIKLPSSDQGLIRRAPTTMLVFEHPIHDAAETIKTALSRALVHYYPISGRIAAAGDDDDQEAHILCNDEGVAFVAAAAGCALREALELFDRSPDARMAALGDELAVAYPAGGCGPTDPLLLMQVTQFSCGGFVVGVTWNHGVADGAGMAQFLQAVGELAVGMPSPSIPPVRWDDSLPSILPASMVARPSSRLAMTRQLEPLDLSFLGITIPSSSIDRIKAEFRDHRSGNGRPCTAFEVIAAVLWRCRTRATAISGGGDPDSPAWLSFAVNLRELAGAKDGYYGNCIGSQHVMAASGVVASAGIVDLVDMIKTAKEGIPERFKKDEDELQPSMIEQQMVKDRYSTLMMSSWRNVGFERADFGGGTPARVMCHLRRRWGLPVCVINPPWKGKDGQEYHVVSACVKEEHVSAFLTELARLA